MEVVENKNKNSMRLINDALIPLYCNTINDIQLPYGNTKRNIINGTTEILDFNFCFDPSESKFIDYPQRPASRDYIEDELKWYMSKDPNIKSHKGISNNPTWQRVSSPEGFVNSNYGEVIWGNRLSVDGVCQYDLALNSLVNTYKDGNSGRQAVMYYTSPDIHKRWNDGIHATADFTCTISVHCFVRDNKLIYMVNMRSNDIFFGLPYDYAWHYEVYHMLRKELTMRLGVDILNGDIYWHADSLHCYEKHIPLLQKIVENI